MGPQIYQAPINIKFNDRERWLSCQHMSATLSPFPPEPYFRNIAYPAFGCWTYLKVIKMKPKVPTYKDMIFSLNISLFTHSQVPQCMNSTSEVLGYTSRRIPQTAADLNVRWTGVTWTTSVWQSTVKLSNVNTFIFRFINGPVYRSVNSNTPMTTSTNCPSTTRWEVTCACVCVCVSVCECVCVCGCVGVG